LKPEVALLLFLLLIIAGGAAMMAISLNSTLRQQRPRRGKSAAASARNTGTMEVYATIVDHTCRVKTIGYQTPTTVQEFTVVFETEDGKLIRLDVPQDMYDGLEKGQTGLLTIVDGNLYSFVPVED